MDYNVAIGILRGLWGQGLKDVEVMPDVLQAYKDGLTPLYRISPDVGDNYSPRGCIFYKDMRVWPLGRLPQNG